MSTYILKRTDQGGGYLARAGSIKAYTRHLEQARTFASIEDALADACGNERVLTVEEAMGGE
jgi:hypothetical protein